MRRLVAPSLFVALLAACSGSEPPAAPPRPVVVEHPQSLAQGTADVFAGSVKARVEASLSFRVPGQILERKVDLGARVAKGTVLAVLDPQDAKLNLGAARAAVKAAEADLWLAKQEEKRYRDLKQRGFIGQSAVDLRVNTTKLSAAKLEQAKSQFDLAQNQSRYTTLTAESDGVITAIFAEVGNVVSAGQPIATFAADGEREIAIQIPEGRAASIAKAPQIGIQLYTNPQRIYTGKIRDLSPQADPATRTHTAHVTIVDADDGVQLGATATVMAGSPGGENTFRLPATAVGGPSPQQTGVWRVTADGNGVLTAQVVKVKVVQVLDTTVIVQGPLSSKDQLITAGVHGLVPGMPVQPIDRSAKVAL